MKAMKRALQVDPVDPHLLEAVTHRPGKSTVVFGRMNWKPISRSNKMRVYASGGACSL